MTEPLPDVIVYRRSGFARSVCVPEDWQREIVEREVNKVDECGTERGWFVSSDETFNGGEPMPCACDKFANRRHWLMDC